MTYKKISIFLILIFSILFLENLQIFKKTFVLFTKDTERRLVDHHGYCGGESVGFIRHLYRKYDFKLTPKIINFTKNIPDNYWSTFNFDKNARKQIFNYNYIILLNYKSKTLINTDKILYYENKKIDLTRYEILENTNNCFLLKLA